MEAIFGNALATGRFALGSEEVLGQNLDDSTVGKVEGTPVAPTPADKAPLHQLSVARPQIIPPHLLLEKGREDFH
jgi:hypothetical protein